MSQLEPINDDAIAIGLKLIINDTIYKNDMSKNNHQSVVDSEQSDVCTIDNAPNATLNHAPDRTLSHDLSEAPIGVFDSGIGGLSVYLHLAQQLPAERYLYYADTKHVPYGNRDSQDIKDLTLTAVQWLYEQGCKLIVIACNSASAHALTIARECYPQIPIVGLVPALKPAVLGSRSGRVAVMATKATLEGTLLNQVIAEIAEPNHIAVSKYFNPELVPWVEAGMPIISPTAIRLRQKLQQLADDDIDYLVLGCTHYPFFKEFLLQEIREQKLPITVVDSGQAIAARVRSLLIEKRMLAASDKTGMDNPLRLYTSKYDDNLGQVIERLLGKQVNIQYVA
ncbi:glutamate racemase [Psychrobacter sp. 2Y5]|uniref:glutamate racemase n=2 Tax=Psychrobacter TaxID=497 RepID=UPI003F4733A2